MHTVKKGRRDHGDVVQMSGPLPRVVGNIHIAFEQVLATYPANEMMNGFRHAIDMTGRSGNRLRQHATRRIVNAG